MVEVGGCLAVVSAGEVEVAVAVENVELVEVELKKKRAQWSCMLGLSAM